MDAAFWVFVQILLEEAVRVLTPIAITAVIGLAGVGAQWVRQRVGEGRWYAITEALEYAVQAAEMAGLRGVIANEGAAKKELAIRLAESFLAERGVKVDVVRLSALVEAVLADTLNRGKVYAGGEIASRYVD